MKAIRTIKLKISGSTKADKVMVLWLKAANWLSKIVFKTKELNSNRLSKAYYSSLRGMGLPSQVANTVCRTVCSTYKTAKTKGKWHLAIFNKYTMSIIWKRDFNRTKKGITLWGELLVVSDPRQLPDGRWRDSKLILINNVWFLILAYEIEIPELNTQGCIVGVDMGIKRMLVATNSANSKTFFFNGGVLNHRRSCIRRTRAAVQSVGTRSSRRLLKRMRGHEASVTGHLLHVASKALVRYAVGVGASRIVVEDLTNIRDSSLNKGKDLRSKVHSWPYAKTRFLIEYKARAAGIELEVVSPKNTSRGCNSCGYVSASNRNGLRFHCKKCNHKDDADRHASKNIRARSVSIKHNSMGTGSPKAPKSYGIVDTATEFPVLNGNSVIV